MEEEGRQGEGEREEWEGLKEGGREGGREGGKGKNREGEVESKK